MRTCLTLILATMLTACGTISSIESPTAGGGERELNFSTYDHVVVLDFDDATKSSNLPAFAGRNFADLIAAEVKSTQAFSEVSRETAEGSSLVVSGDVTRYADGNAALRLLIGFGAGSSFFDAVVRFTDSETGEDLGEMVVDKNSWVLGGGLAAFQNVEHFMDAAADRVAKELATAKSLE